MTMPRSRFTELDPPSRVIFCSSLEDDSGSMTTRSSLHNLKICVSIALMSVIAVANCCKYASSAAMLSADAASAGIGVADRVVGDPAD